MYAKVREWHEELVGYEFKTLVTFEISPRDLKELPEECELKIEKYSPERNTDQNAKYWAVVGEIAKITGVSVTEMHNSLMNDYGELETVDGKPVVVWRSIDYDYTTDRELHLKPANETARVDGELIVKYYKLKNSKNLTKKQFSRLLDGAIYERRSLEEM